MVILNKNGATWPTSVDKWQFSQTGFMPQEATFEIILYNVAEFIIGIAE